MWNSYSWGICLVVSFAVVDFTNAIDFKLNIDYSTAPGLEADIPKVRDAIEDYYPRLADYLATPGFEPASEITLVFNGSCEGYASSSNRKYIACAKDLQKNGIQEHDIGFLVMMVGQSAMGYPGNHKTSPQWLTLCMREYGRYYIWAKENKPNRPPANKSPKTVSAKECSYFLDYVNTNYPQTPTPPDVIQQLSKNQRERTYSDAIFMTMTGKSGKDLWKEMQEQDN